jgi:DNA-binding NarL/FixJ family response regulator
VSATTSAPLRIVVADDHALVRAGFRALLARFLDFEVVAEAANGHDALRLLAEHAPDLALIDISMPGLNGLETTRRATKEHPGTRIVVLSMHSDEEYVRQAFASGAAGYLLKNASEGELEIALRAVARGDAWLSPGVARPVMTAFARDPAAPPGPFELLTARQREILQLIAEGHSTKDVARRLGRSVKTVETHRAQIMERLGIRSLQGLVRYAVRVGLVQSDS